MKVGDTVKLKPAMWQGIKPESYGLSFTGEYIVSSFADTAYSSIKLEGFSGSWDAQAFQIVVKEREKEVSKFKVGDKVLCVSSDGFDNLNIGEVYTVSNIYSKDAIAVKEVKDFVHYNKRFIEAASVESIERPVLEERKKDKIRMELFDEGFPNAILEVAKVMTWASENKGYKDHDWVNLPDADSAFSAAASRHKLKGIIQKLNGVEALQRTDEESNILHKAHEAFNVLAELELMLRGVIK